jgi:predicted aspartyl protease
MIDIIIGGLALGFLVDTGADISIINEIIVKRLGLEVKPYEMSCASASGHALITKGAVQVEIEIEEE